jgi:hypothetical protein
MSKEKGEELFWALHRLLDAITGLNFKDLEAEAQAGSSKQGVPASSIGKAKDPDSDWTEVPCHPVSITPLSTRPRFSQVVGSPSETPIVPPSQVSIEAVSLAEHLVYIPAVIAVWAAMNAPAGGGGQNAHNQGAQPQGQGAQQQVPQGGGGQQDGNGGGQGGIGNGQDGGGQAPLAYTNAAQFLAAWNASPSNQARDKLKQEAINRIPAMDVLFATILKINLQWSVS